MLMLSILLVLAIGQPFAFCKHAPYEEATYKQQGEILPDKRLGIGFHVSRLTPQELQAEGRITSPYNNNSDTYVRRDIGLYRHAYPNKFSNYDIRTCPYLFLTPSISHALEQAADLQGTVYIYSVHLDYRSIDLRQTFDEHKSRWEDRLAEFGDILVQQVEGWRRFDGKYHKYVRNPKYKAKLYYKAESHGGAPRLAGFPVGHKALSEEPWKKWKCNPDPKSTDSLQTCQPDELYSRKYEQEPAGSLQRLREGNEEEGDCVYFSSWLLAVYPEHIERVDRFKGSLSACGYYRSAMMTVSCGDLKEFKVGFKLRPEVGNGTWDITEVTLLGLAEVANVTVNEMHRADHQAWESVKVTEISGWDTVAIETIDALNILAKENMSQPHPAGKDNPWTLQGIDLEAKCSNTNTIVKVSKLASLDKGYQKHIFGWQRDDMMMESFPIVPADWKALRDDSTQWVVPRFDDWCLWSMSHFWDCFTRLYPSEG